MCPYRAPKCWARSRSWDFGERGVGQSRDEKGRLFVPIRNSEDCQNLPADSFLNLIENVDRGVYRLRT